MPILRLCLPIYTNTQIIFLVHFVHFGFPLHTSLCLVGDSIPYRFALFLCPFQIAHIPTNTRYQCDRISCGSTTIIFMIGNYAITPASIVTLRPQLSNSRTIHYTWFHGPTCEIPAYEGSENLLS